MTVPATHEPWRDGLLIIEVDGGRPVVAGPHSFEVSRAVPTERDRFAKASWRWDGKTLRAETSDRGLVGLYYASRPGRLVVGTDIRRVMAAAAPLSLDRASLLLFYLLNQFVDGHTAFNEVKALPLSASLTWDAANGVRIARRPLLEPVPWTGTVEAAERRCDEIIRDVVANNRGTGDHVLALSGGRDSRHILFALRASGLSVDRIVTAHHYLDFSYSDLSVARQVADRFGMSVEVVQPFPDRVAAEIGKNWATGLQSMEHSWGIALGHGTAGSRTVYDGLNGGSLLGRSRLASIERRLFPGGDDPPPWPQRVGRIVEDIVRPEAVAVLPPFLHGARNVEAARALLAERLSLYADYPNPAQAFRLFETGPRDFALLTLGLLRNREVICPFDHENFAAFALGLPWRLSVDYGFHARAVRAAYPAFAAIPFEVDAPYPRGRPLTDREAEWRTFDRAIAAVGAKRAAKLIPNLEKLRTQTALGHGQIQRTMHALQVNAARRGEDVLLGLLPHELPPLPELPADDLRIASRRPAEPDL